MLDFLLGDVLKYVIGAVALLAGILGYGLKKKRDGKLEERRRQEEVERRLTERLHDEDYDTDAVSSREYLRNRK